MTSISKRALGATIAASAVTLVTGFFVPAQADDTFGQHVRTCAQTMGFDGQMNPGMHRGNSGAGMDC